MFWPEIEMVEQGGAEGKCVLKIYTCHKGTDYWPADGLFSGLSLAIIRLGILPYF